VRVLDLGCGITKNAREMWPDAEYVGVDINEAVEPDVVADVREIPEDVGKFDTVYASHILEHLMRFEIVPTLRHWASFLKPGGQMIVVVPDLGWACERIARMMGSASMAELMMIYGSGGNELQQHYFGFTVPMLRSSMERAGLTVVMMRSGSFVMHIGDTDGEDVEGRQIVAVGILPGGSENVNGTTGP